MLGGIEGKLNPLSTLYINTRQRQNSGISTRSKGEERTEQ